jgi:hypothetical protein
VPLSAGYGRMRRGYSPTMNNPNEPASPVRRDVEGEAGGATYETPLTLGPESDHTHDPIRGNAPHDNVVPVAPSTPTDEPASDGPLNPA